MDYSFIKECQKVIRDNLKAEQDKTVAGYADQIQAANAARFVHNLDNNHCNIWISQEPQGGPKRH